MNAFAVGGESPCTCEQYTNGAIVRKVSAGRIVACRVIAQVVEGMILVAAAEIACYAYCPEQWRLEYGLRLEAATDAGLNADTRHHERKAAAERIVGGSVGMRRLLIAVGPVLLLLLWLMWR
jgi:hypothetical protein